jgi:hypothetical protein
LFNDSKYLLTKPKNKEIFNINLLRKNHKAKRSNSEAFTNSRYAGVFNKRKSTMSHILVYNVEEFGDSMKAKRPSNRKNRFSSASQRNSRLFQSLDKHDKHIREYSREKKDKEIFEFLQKKNDLKTAGLSNRRRKHSFYRYYDRFGPKVARSDQEEISKFVKEAKFNENMLIKSALVRRMKISPLDILRRIENCKTLVESKSKLFNTGNRRVEKL